MAAIYNIELVSHYQNYSAEQLQNMLEKALTLFLASEKKKGNPIQIEVTKKV